MAPNVTYKTCLFLNIQDVSGKPLIGFTAIATSVIGLLSSIGSVFGNGLVLYVIVKVRRLRTPSNILIGNLCISDFTTGFIVVPMISIRRITEAYGSGICVVRIICAYFAYLTVVVSIVTICMISIDRYFAIMRPFLYQRTITVTKYVVTVSIIWLILCVYSSLPFLRVMSGKSFFEIAFIVMTVTIIIFILCYARISSVAKSHRRKLHLPSTVSRQEEVLPNPLPQRPCIRWTIKVVPVSKQGTNENLSSDDNTSSNEPGVVKKSEKVQVHSLHQDHQKYEMRHSEAITSSLLLEESNNGKLCPTTETTTNREFSTNVIPCNSIHSKQLDPTISQKCVHSALNQRRTRKSSKKQLDHDNFAASGKSDVKDLADSIHVYTEDTKVLKNTEVESSNSKHTLNHVPVTLTSNEKYNLNKGEQKKTNTVAILIFIAVLCYGPLAIIYILRSIIGDTFEIIYIADPWADLILYVNSTINPIIYCLRGREFRGAVKRVLPQCLMNLFRNMTSCKQSDLQQSS